MELRGEKLVVTDWFFLAWTFAMLPFSLLLSLR